MGQSIGMIETKGLLGALKATDTMLKAADVTLLKQEKAGGALVTVYIEGDVSAVKSALQAGMDAVGSDEVITSHMISRPAHEIKELLIGQEEPRKKTKTSSKSKPATKGKTEKNDKAEK